MQQSQDSQHLDVQMSSLNVTNGFSTVQSLTATDITVGAGVTISGDINVALVQQSVLR